MKFKKYILALLLLAVVVYPAIYKIKFIRRSG